MILKYDSYGVSFNYNSFNLVPWSDKFEYAYIDTYLFTAYYSYPFLF